MGENASRVKAPDHVENNETRITLKLWVVVTAYRSDEHQMLVDGLDFGEISFGTIATDHIAGCLCPTALDIN